MDDKNTVKVYTSYSGAELSISAPSTKQIISATNNRAQYFAEQAKKYRDEAKLYKDNAKYYAEQNSDVTFEYINNVRSALEDKIAEKQDLGNYALREELPVNVSELINDAEYVNQTELDEVRLPSQEGCAGMVLVSDGESERWSGINSFQLFDTKLSDCILEGEESLGWALQGTYVSKAIYPDFYAKCMEEYQNSTQVFESWTQPTLSANGTVGGTSYACRASSNESSSFPTCYAFDGNSSTRWSPSARSLPQYLDFYSPEPIIPTSVYLDFYEVAEAYTAGIIQGSNDGSSWDDLSTFSNNTAQTLTISIQTEKSYQYIRFYPIGLPSGSTAYGKVTEMKISATKAFSYLKNSNGHKFYDIANKSQVDILFEQTGLAWFYGIDTENERIFLPRKQILNLLPQTELSVKVSSISYGSSAPHQLIRNRADGNTINTFQGSGGIGLNSYNGGHFRTEGPSDNTQADVVLDPNGTYKVSLENNIEENVYLYICVGNIIVNKALVDVGQLSSDLQYKADKTEVDGQWGNKALTIIANTSVNANYTNTVDLSDYLPNDGYAYEIMLNCLAKTGSTSGNMTQIIASSSICPAFHLAQCITRNSNQNIIACTVNMAIGSDRKLNISCGDTTGTGELTIYARNYRRIGTNL